MNWWLILLQTILTFSLMMFSYMRGKVIGYYIGKRDGEMEKLMNERRRNGIY